MKISYSIMLLVAVAASQINAAATPNAASKCIAGSSGKGQGDGYKNYCCKDQSDCLDDCVKGVCVGPVKPTATTTKPSSIISTTVAPTVAPTTAPGTCTPGSSGLGKGDGYKGACCKNEADCLDDCVKGACVGPVNTKTVSSTKTASTTSAPTTVPTPGACTPGSIGLGKGDGYKDACCKDQSDCIDDCVKGACVGPVNTKTVSSTKTASTTSAPTTVPTPGACTPGSIGLGKGDGYKDACCKDQSDCIDDCVKGACVGPVNTKTATKTTSSSTIKTSSATPSTPTPDACIAGFFGKGNGKGGDNACCKDQSDCKESCLSGKCGVA